MVVSSCRPRMAVAVGGALRELGFSIEIRSPVGSPPLRTLRFFRIMACGTEATHHEA